MTEIRVMWKGKNAQVIDLTKILCNGMLVDRGDPKFSLTRIGRIEKEGYNSSKLVLGTHTGTHVDVPYHFVAEGKKLHEVALQKFVGDALILDFTGKQAGDIITARDLARTGSRMKRGTILVLKTGWSERAENPNYFSNHPQISIDAARWLIKKDISAIGVDFPAVSRDHKVHKMLLEHEILLFEDLTNLKKIKRKRFKFIGLPLRIRDADASPIRAIGVEE